MRLPVLPFLACAAAATAVAAIPFSQDDFMLNSELPVDFDSPKMHALFAKLASLAAAPPPSPGGRRNRLARSMLTALCSSGCPRQETDAVEPGVNPALPPPSPTISLADPIAAEYAEALLKHDSRALYAMAECPVCLECMHPKTLTVTPCGHAMHMMCLVSAVRRFGSHCPVCGTKYPREFLTNRDRTAESRRKEKYLKEVLGLFVNQGWIPPKSDRARVLVDAPPYSEFTVAEETEPLLRLERARLKTWDKFIKARLKTNIDLVQIIITDIAVAFFNVEDAVDGGNVGRPGPSRGGHRGPAAEPAAEPASEPAASEPADDEPPEPSNPFPDRPYRGVFYLISVWLPTQSGRPARPILWLNSSGGAGMLCKLESQPHENVLKALASTEPESAFLARADFMDWVLNAMRHHALNIAPSGIEIPAVDLAGRLRDLGVPVTWMSLLVYGWENAYRRNAEFPAPFRIPRAAADWLTSMAETLFDSLRDELTWSDMRADRPRWLYRIGVLEQMVLTLAYSSVWCATYPMNYERLEMYEAHVSELKVVLGQEAPTDEEFGRTCNQDGSHARKLITLETLELFHWH